MNQHSHRKLAIYLSKNFLSHIPSSYKKAFHLGCVSPDINPLTYLKGSLKYQLLRGHNWQNAKKYINKLSSELERKQQLSTLDYYMLGKLIHYLSDAFTFTHNTHFLGNLAAHKNYEALLETYLYHQLCRSLLITEHCDSIQQIIRYHRLSYMHSGTDIRADAAYIQKLCIIIILHLHSKPE